MVILGWIVFGAFIGWLASLIMGKQSGGCMVNIALGAVDKALVELKTTGRMTEAQKGSLSREMSEKVEQVQELNARSRKYNLPRPSAPEH